MGGRDQGDHGLWPAQGKSSQDPLSPKAGVMAHISHPSYVEKVNSRIMIQASQT
jgi:hypothetical protein